MPSSRPSPTVVDWLARAVDRRQVRRWRACLAVTGLLAPAVTGAQAPSGIVDEYHVKAAYVFRFTQFVTWPSAAVAASPTVDVCVLRPNPFCTELEQMVRGEAIGGRSLRIREIRAAPDQLAGCHALFVGAATGADPDLMQEAAGRHILTVGESERFLQEGGIIALRVIDRRVRFEVDADNARRAGIRIAAQLLNLAVRVRGGTP